MSDANRTQLGFIAESTYGTTPSSALQALRFTSESLNNQESTVESAEILSDRNLVDVIRTGEYGQGTINGELSAGTLDTLLEGVLAGSWSSNVLENGTTKKSYTFEKLLNVDGSPSAHYLAFKGCRLDTLDLTIPTEGVIGYSLGIMGKAGINALTTAGSGAYTAAGTTEPLAADKLTAFTEASASIISDVVSVNLSLSNNLRRQMRAGSTEPRGYGYGGFRVTGTLVLYFENMDLFDKYEAETKTELEFTVTDSASKAYTFTIPKTRWGTPTIDIQGVNGDVQASFPFTGVKDAGATESTISITRVP